MLTNDTVSDGNYNSLLRDLLTQNLIKGDESTKVSAEVNNTTKNKLTISSQQGHIKHSFTEDLEVEKKYIPQRIKNDLIYPDKFKNNYNKIKRYEFSQEENSGNLTKDWDA
jgi:hypothetical protein